MSGHHALPPLPRQIAEAARVVILTRAGCCLCDEAIAVAADVCTELSVSLHLEDVDADATLREQWNDHVPVTFIDGERHAIWVLDGAVFRNALTSISS